MRRRIERLLLVLAPAELREWIAAMLWAARLLDRRERLNWCLAAAGIALRYRIARASLEVQAVGLAVVMLIVDWTWGALAPALLLMAVSAAVLTKERTRTRAAAFLVAGGTLPIAHAVANWIPSLRPHYQYAPLDFRDWTILAAVAAIGVCAVRISILFQLSRQSKREI